MDVLQVIDEISRNVPTAQHGEHIGDNGLLCCDNCGTARQIKITVMGVERIVRCICKCENDQAEAEKAERERRELAEKIKRLRNGGFSEKEMQRWTFAADDLTRPEITKIMRAFVANFERFREDGKGLILWGGTGTGKTFAAACIANALIDKGYPVMVTNFARIINKIQSSFDGRNEYIDSLNKYPLLVIDDLATERNTAFANEIVYAVIDSRCRAGLPLIVTTNLSMGEILNAEEMAAKRIYSRIAEMCVPVKVDGADRRKEALKRERSGYAKLLGMEG